MQPSETSPLTTPQAQGQISPLVSVVVPTCNSAATLEACLRSIVNQRHLRVELIVVDNASRDRTREIAAMFTKLVFDRGPERSAQRNFGARQGSGEFVLFIDSDMELSPDVVGSCVSRAKTEPRLQAIVIPEESFGVGFWAHCKKLERSFYVGVEWMEAARFFRKTVFEELGGYNETFTGWEDFDLPQRLEAVHGARAIGRIDEYIYHNEQVTSLRGLGRKRFYYARHGARKYMSVESNRGKYVKQLSVLQRYRLYFSQPRRLLRQPVVGLGMLFMKTWEFACAAAGFLAGKIRPS
jgi:glycosyltransferase involved in cell wall biosynthesis